MNAIKRGFSPTLRAGMSGNSYLSARSQFQIMKSRKSTREIGFDGEKQAVALLKKEGYRILHKNYTCRLGEIDIIALHKKILVFVEVKARSTKAFGSAEFAVTLQKRRQIIRVAEAFLADYKVSNTDCRFDVVAINNGTHPEIKLLKDAFRADDVRNP